MQSHFAARRRAAALVAFTTAAAALLMVGPSAGAAQPDMQLGTAAQYSVLGHSTVTNTGPSVLHQNLGLWSGTSITGFGGPDGQVVPPATIHTTDAAAHQAQDDLTTAYVKAAGLPDTATTANNLGNKHLMAGVYSGPAHGALGITGPLVLDGAGDPNSVFVFQTDSTLTTHSASTVTLINGAQECNVYWQVGSSATLGTGSVFAGNIMALASVTVTTGVTVHGRALASTAAVTLDTDVFQTPTCDLTPITSPSTTPSSLPGGVTTLPGGGTGTTLPGGGTGSTLPGGGTASTLPGGGTGTTLPGSATPTLPGTPPGRPGVPGVTGPPRTGGGPQRSASFPWLAVLVAGFLGTAALGGTLQRRRAHARLATAHSTSSRSSRR